MSFQGRNEGRARGNDAPGAESLGTPKSPHNIASAFFNTVHLLPEDLRFEHGGAKLFLFPGEISNLSTPCVFY